MEDPSQGTLFISVANPEGSGKEELKKFGIIVRNERGTFIHKLYSRNRKKKIIQLYNLNPNTIWKEIKAPAFQEQLTILDQYLLSDKHQEERFQYLLIMLKEVEHETTLAQWFLHQQ